MIGALSDPESRRDDQQVAAAEGVRDDFKTQILRQGLLLRVHAAYLQLKPHGSLIFVRSNTYPGVDYSSGFILELHVGPSP